MLYFMKTKPFCSALWRRSGICWTSCRKGLFSASFILNAAHFCQTSPVEVSQCLKIIPYSVALFFSLRFPHTLLSVLILPSHLLQEFFGTHRRWQLQPPHDRLVFVGKLRQHIVEGMSGHARGCWVVGRDWAGGNRVLLVDNPW